MRVLSFDLEKDKSTFEVMYEGFMLTEMQMGRAEHRRHTKILDKIDLISVYKDEDKDARTINSNQSLILEEEEYSFMINCLEQVKYRALASRKVDSMWSFLENVKEESLKVV